jgi:hypothetical protein
MVDEFFMAISSLWGQAISVMLIVVQLTPENAASLRKVNILYPKPDPMFHIKAPGGGK